MHNRRSRCGIGCNGCTSDGAIVKGIIPPEDEVPLREKFPLPLEVVLDKQVATIKAASTDAQSSALLAVARVEVADLDSRQLVASMEVFLDNIPVNQRTARCPELIHLLVVVRAVEDLVVVPESQVSNPA